ncbi:MAG: anthrone oxygenase family protein [Nocardioidaceae bacterium]
MKASAILLAAALTGSLQAGTYYVFSCGVMPGLARGDDETFVRAMQGINTAIVNPAFLVTFLGAPLLAVGAAVATPGPARTWAVAGAVLAVGTVLVTGAGNVPLNDALDAVGQVTGAAAADARAAFESSWVRLNLVRSVTSAASVGCLVWAALRS